MCKTKFGEFMHGDSANTAASIEDAYRRGVHQTFAMLEYFLEETGADIGEVLPVAVKKAKVVNA